MKIDLSTIDSESFMVHQHFVGDVPVLLVQPTHIGVHWTKENLIFRSSVWTMDGELISASFPKFFNWDEKPEITPPPENLNGAKMIEKLDGSTLIFSRYKGYTIIRTRGTVNARTQDNGYEIDYLIAKYDSFIRILENEETSDFSVVFEWTSPTNRIVIDYGVEPDMKLIAIINHKDYSLMSQSGLDNMAEALKLLRPRSFSYDSIEEMKSSIEALRGQEGICVYYNNGQNIRKVKSAQYLFLHRAKSDIASLEKVIDLYMNTMEANNFVAPTYQEFFNYLSETFDFEIATMATGHVSRIADGMKEVQKIIDGMKVFVQPVLTMNRKDAAGKILQAYGTTGRSAMLFKMYDHKPLDSDSYKKLLYQVLK